MKNIVTLFLCLIASTLLATAPDSSLHNNYFLPAHGGSIEGLVVDSETNTGIAGATVRLAPVGRVVTTDELGLFRFIDLPGGAYTLTASYVGAEMATATITVQDHGTSPIRLTLRPASIELADVEIVQTPNRPLSTLNQLDLRTRPLNSAQDVLRFVPGLVIAQHAGGGKAEQLFLRGFDLDHGTDIALTADGMPVNMVSHAHGQGYADLHFLIPELIDRVDFQKGPYDARAGNLATAGQVNFRTADVLRQSFIGLEAGQYDTYRLVSALDLLGARGASRGASAYVAGETLFSNGYFDAPQDFKRLNFQTKFRQALADDQVLTIGIARFSSSWRASGQIPERAVSDGRLGFYGAIDPNEGGRTSRTNINVEYARGLAPGTVLRQQLFTCWYDFELYSNFTFFLHDSINGDEIRQRERRQITGYRGAILHQAALAGRPLALEGGLQLRYDEVRDNELSRTLRRAQTLSRLALGDVQELNLSAYVDAQWQLTARLTVNAALRFDQFHFSYQNRLDTLQPFRTKARARPSPKLNASYRVNDHFTVFAQSGVGFHSNDTRVSVAAPPGSNELPRAFGLEAGLVLKPWPNVLLTTSLWQLDLEQEFVYVGDEAVIEPSGRTRRRGIDLSLRYQVMPWLYFDADYNLTRPRAVDVPENETYIPLAPLQTSSGGLTVDFNGGFSGSLRYRYLADRPANEDNSLRAEGFFLLDALLSYAPVFSSKKSPLELTLSVQNLTDARWKEAQFETESRLRNEAMPVSEIHFTPGTPFFFKGGLRFRF